jgi:hypothetical protein
MTRTSDNPRFWPVVKRASALAFAAVLALGTLSVAAHADDRRDDHRGGRPAPRPVDHRRPDRGGYYAPPPVVYGGPVYAPPPVVYSPGVSINLPGASINIP